MLKDLTDRGVQDVLLFCVGSLSSLKQTIGAVLPSENLLEKILYLASLNVTKRGFSDYPGEVSSVVVTVFTLKCI